MPKRQRSWWATAGLLTLPLGVVLVGLGPSLPPDAATAPQTTAAEAQTAVDDLLARRAAAWESSDLTGWQATVDERALAGQTAIFETLRRLPLDAWSEELEALQPGGHGEWRASVVVRYRFVGDHADALVRGVLDITAELRVAGATTTPVPPWAIDDVTSATGEHSLVVGAAAPATLRRYADELDRASRSIGLFLDTSPPRVVLVLPGDWQQARRMVPGGGAQGLAALTTPLGPAGLPAGPVRVLADPGVLAGLDVETRVALLGHETFHVATLGWGAVPLWLSEGLADYAGYRESAVPVETAVAGLIRLVRADAVPSELPDDAAYSDPTRATEAYEGAYLAVRMLAAEHGDERVLELYRRVAHDGIDVALADVLGTDLASVTSRWRAEVAALADR
jgi:hypothetical protein